MLPPGVLLANQLQVVGEVNARHTCVIKQYELTKFEVKLAECEYDSFVSKLCKGERKTM